MKNNKKIMISVLVISILVLIFSLTYIFLINKTSDKTLLMKSFEEISNVIESNLPSKEINNFVLKAEINSNFFNKINFEIKNKNTDFEILVNNTILTYQNKEAYIYNSNFKDLGFLKNKDLVNSSLINNQNYKENYMIIKNSMLKALEKILKPSNFKKTKEKNIDKYILKINNDDMASFFQELSQDKNFTELYKKLTNKEFNDKENSNFSNKETFEYVVYAKDNKIQKVLIDKEISIVFNNEYKTVYYKNKNIDLKVKIKNNTIFENVNLKYNNINFDMTLISSKSNQYNYDIKYNYLSNTYTWKLIYIKEKYIELTGNDINLKANIDMNKNVTLTKVDSTVREATNEELEGIVINLLQTIIKA